jgi:hypothetical protein
VSLLDYLFIFGLERRCCDNEIFTFPVNTMRNVLRDQDKVVSHRMMHLFANPNIKLAAEHKVSPITYAVDMFLVMTIVSSNHYVKLEVFAIKKRFNSKAIINSSDDSVLAGYFHRFKYSNKGTVIGLRQAKASITFIRPAGATGLKLLMIRMV